MSFKDILVPILSVRDDEPALLAAEVVAESFGANVAALLLEVEPEPVYTLEGAGMPVVWPDLLDQTHKEFVAEKKKLDARAAQGPRPITTRGLSIIPTFIDRDLGVAARSADLTVLLRPSEPWQEWRTRMFEGVLFGAGRPLLVAPPNFRRGSIGRNIIVAWNGKREAARALADAGPFLDLADKITIVTVNAGKAAEPSDASLDELASHFARKGLRAETRTIDDLGLGEATALFAEAKALGADLVVMGGYGRSRLGEFIFGGVTHEAVKSAGLPLFMSH